MTAPPPAYPPPFFPIISNYMIHAKEGMGIQI